MHLMVQNLRNLKPLQRVLSLSYMYHRKFLFLVDRFKSKGFG